MRQCGMTDIIRFRCLQAKRNPQTGEFGPKVEVEVLFPDKIYPESFSDAGSQLTEWMSPVGARDKQTPMIGQHDENGIIYWTSPTGEQWVQWIEFNLDDVRRVFRKVVRNHDRA